EPWLLGTSEKSSILAAEKGLPYTFGHFMSSADGPAAIQMYLDAFKANYLGNKPKTIVAVSIICAETDEEAEQLAWSNYLWKIKQDQTTEDIKIPSLEEALNYNYSKEDLKAIEKMKRKMIIGSP